MKKQGSGLAARPTGIPWRPAVFVRTRRRSLLALGMDRLPEPVYLINRTGRLVESNAAGNELLGLLPAEGNHGAIGKRELEELFARAAGRELGAAPLRVETMEGSRHYEARFAPADPAGYKTIVFSDVTIWKRALAEKDALLHAIRSEQERPVSVCASCGSIKDSEGDWGPAGGVARSGLAPERLSHGLCPSCLAEQLGHAGLGQAAIAAALAQTQRRH